MITDCNTIMLSKTFRFDAFLIGKLLSMIFLNLFSRIIRAL